MENNKDMVNHPEHYQSGNIECIDAIADAISELKGIEAFDTGNCIKYLWRWRKKNGVEDLKKTRWYLCDLIHRLDENDEIAKIVLSKNPPPSKDAYKIETDEDGNIVVMFTDNNGKVVKIPYSVPPLTDTYRTEIDENGNLVFVFTDNKGKVVKIPYYVPPYAPYVPETGKKWWDYHIDITCCDSNKNSTTDCTNPDSK